jgi:hypothetical protein
MTTLVSAFLSNVNTRRPVEEYIEFGKHFLLADINKVIFIDEILYDNLSIYENEKTKFIKINKQTIYLYSYIDKIINFSLGGADHTKDTLDYIIIMCNKTEWVKEAIEMDLYKTDQFVWVDFGIRYIFNCSDHEYRSKIESLNCKSYDNVRIASIWDLNVQSNKDCYAAVMWYFAGGVFGGPKDKLLLFSELMKKKCLDIIEAKGTLTWEVNIWYLIYQENNCLFDRYYCDHNNSIIDNY